MIYNNNVNSLQDDLSMMYEVKRMLKNTMTSREFNLHLDIMIEQRRRSLNEIIMDIGWECIEPKGYWRIK